MARDEFSSLTDYQIYTQNLTFKIKDHFSEVVRNIAGYLKQRDDQSRPHIWASYEALFFTSTILPDIEKFYVLAYDGEAKLLQMLLPTANPRNMKLGGEWVIDILDLVKHTRPKTTKNAVDSVSHVPLALNLVEEMKNLFPFLRGMSLGSTDLNNLHAITPDPQSDHIKQKSQIHSVKQCLAPYYKSQNNCNQIVPEEPVSFEDTFSHPSGELVIDILDPVKTTRPGTAEKATQTDLTSSDEKDSGTSRSGTTSTAKQAFHRQAKALEDLDTHRSNPDQGQHSNQTLRGATVGVGAEEHQLYYADSVSHVSLASNLIEEMESLYTFLRDVTVGSTDQSDLPAITPEPQIDQIVQKAQVQSGKQCLPPISESQTNRKKIVPKGPVSFEDMFSRAYKCLRMVIQESLPLMKLRWLVMCLQAMCDSLKEQVSCILADKDRSIGNDDLLPSLILFLIKGNPGQVTALYPQLKFLEDYLPDIVANGIIGFTVAQFSAAFAFIIQTDGVDT